MSLFDEIMVHCPVKLSFASSLTGRGGKADGGGTDASVSRADAGCQRGAPPEAARR